MRIDELHKFSDGTLNDVRNALDDLLKGIRMQYLPQTIWRKGDKDRAAAMIQAINKMLKTRRIMRSLERFVGGRLCEGDFWMLSILMDLQMVAATKPKNMQKAVQISGALTDEAVRNGSIKKDYRDVHRNVNPVKAKNPTVRACYEFGSIDHVSGGQGHGNQGNQTRDKAFMLGAEEARQDANIVTSIEPSEFGFRYETKIASRQQVKIDKVIKGCKLEIESHVFNIDLIPFGHGSFDVIIGMDWLSNHKRTRTGNVFATTVSHVRRDNTGAWPKCATYNSYHAPGGPCRTCFNCNHPGHLAKDCRSVPRNVNPVNAINPPVRACYECGSTDHVRPACPRLNRAQGPE
nr:hypothetical protein [Tanacetum cinerariifolium]